MACRTGLDVEGVNMDRREDAIGEALNLARWQGKTDARLDNLEGGQRELAIAIGRVDAKVDGLKTWLLTAVASAGVSAIVTIGAAVANRSGG